MAAHQGAEDVDAPDARNGAPQPIAEGPLQDFRCAGCGYGARRRAAPERCPMCAGTLWEVARSLSAVDLSEFDAAAPLGREAATAIRASGSAWICRCGQLYRVSGIGEGIRYWPEEDAGTYGPDGLRADRACINCGERIRVIGLTSVLESDETVGESLP
jgi:hypothetical protein